MSWPLLACVAGSISAALIVLFGVLDGVITDSPPVPLMVAGFSGFAGALIGMALHRHWFVKLGE